MDNRMTRAEGGAMRPGLLADAVAVSGNGPAGTHIWRDSYALWNCVSAI